MKINTGNGAEVHKGDLSYAADEKIESGKGEGEENRTTQNN